MTQAQHGQLGPGPPTCAASPGTHACSRGSPRPPSMAPAPPAPSHSHSLCFVFSSPDLPTPAPAVSQTAPPAPGRFHNLPLDLQNIPRLPDFSSHRRHAYRQQLPAAAPQTTGLRASPDYLTLFPNLREPGGVEPGGSGSESPEVPRRLHHPESWLGPEGRRLAAGLRSPPTGLSSSSPWGSSRRMSYTSWRGSWAPRKAGGKRAATTEALGFISKFRKVLPGAIGPTARP